MQILEERTESGASSLSDAQALIEEARARAHRRRLSCAMVLVLLLLVGLLSLIAIRTSSRPSRVSQGTPQVQTAGNVHVLKLSPSDRYESLAIVDGRLVLSGGPGGSLVQSASDAAQSASQLRGCHSAVVNPKTLRLSDIRAGACENPALYGERVLPINSVVLGSKDASTIRIAVVTADGKSYRIGPVVMRYSEVVTTDAEWIYGDGSLWIYDPLVTATSAELLRVSEQTGAVLQRVVMPQLPEPLLAVNSRGLWLAARASVAPIGLSRAGLYVVTPGTNSPRLISSQSVEWLYASGHSVWFENSNDSARVWSIRGGSDATWTALSSGATSALGYGSPDGSPSDPGYGAPGYAIDSSRNFWLVNFPNESPATGNFKGSETQQVTRLSLASGSSSLVANLQPMFGYGNLIQFASDGKSWLDQATIGLPNSGVALDSPEWANHLLTINLPIVTIGDVAYVLDPPAHGQHSSGKFVGFSALYRITPKHN